MKLIVIAALALVAVAVAAPADKVVTIVRSGFEHLSDGGYNFNFESEDGTSRIENGEIKEVTDAENKPHKVISVRGSFDFVDPEGHPHSVKYVADENGYRAESEDTPKA